MSFYEDVKARTYIAGTTIPQFAFVVGPAADGQVDLPSAGGRATGVALQAGAVGDAIAVAYDGRVMVKAAGIINRGAAVQSDAAGEALAATTGDYILGYALEAAVDNQIFTIELARSELISA